LKFEDLFTYVDGQPGVDIGLGYLKLKGEIGQVPMDTFGRSLGEINFSCLTLLAIVEKEHTQE